MAPALGLGIVGAVLAGADNNAAAVVGWVLIASAAVLIIVLANQFRQARIAYRDGEVLFNLRAGAPIAVPVEVLEAFFLGQGPANLPAAGGRPAEAVNLVARLSQKAPEWEHVDVKPALGRWCESYVTIRGMWCEPRTTDVIRRLKRRLREVREGEAPAEPNARGSARQESRPPESAHQGE
ncbi:MAG TPA: hypothetical protein VF175_04555 [Lacipirellula sp.]